MKEVDPKSTSRALAFELWMKAPMPMVTLMKTLDVTDLVHLSRKRGYKFNMLLCWCIGKAAAEMEDFYLLPVGDKLMQYDRLAVNTVVATRDGGIATCDTPVSSELEEFDRDYRKLTRQVPEKVAARHLADILPVPSHPAGRHPGGRISGTAAAENPKTLNFPLGKIRMQQALGFSPGVFPYLIPFPRQENAHQCRHQDKGDQTPTALTELGMRFLLLVLTSQLSCITI